VLQAWFETVGAQRPTLGTTRSGATKVRVANVFDVEAVFETCWPDGLATDASFRPDAEKLLAHLEAEYPYPENVDYLSES
jgi:hypothetical protein